MLTRCSRKFQSTGLSGRSLEDLVHLIAPSFKLSWKATTKPKRIVYPTDFASLLSDKQNALMDEFVTAWEKTLNVKADRISLADAWAKNPPQDAGNKQPLGDYLGNVSKPAPALPGAKILSNMQKIGDVRCVLLRLLPQL